MKCQLRDIPAGQLQSWIATAEQQLNSGWTDPHNDHGRELREMQVRAWKAELWERIPFPDRLSQHEAETILANPQSYAEATIAIAKRQLALMP